MLRQFPIDHQNQIPMDQNPPPIPASSTPARYSLNEFVESSAQRDRGQGLFELETPRLLELNLDGEIWTKMGSMVAYRGEVKFSREGMLDQGVANLLKKAISSEGAHLTKAQGRGKVYLADAGKKVIIVKLQNEEIIVNGNDLLAFEPSIEYRITMMKKLGAMLAGGLFNIRLSGTGMIAFTSHYEPVTLRVTPDSPRRPGQRRVDPDAFPGRRIRRDPALRRDRDGFEYRLTLSTSGGLHDHWANFGSSGSPKGMLSMSFSRALFESRSFLSHPSESETVCTDEVELLAPIQLCHLDAIERRYQSLLQHLLSVTDQSDENVDGCLGIRLRHAPDGPHSSEIGSARSRRLSVLAEGEKGQKEPLKSLLRRSRTVKEGTA
jgi:uncharacterized protein (AIM24 family)